MTTRKGPLSWIAQVKRPLAGVRTGATCRSSDVARRTCARCTPAHRADSAINLVEIRRERDVNLRRFIMEGNRELMINRMMRNEEKPRGTLRLGRNSRRLGREFSE